MSGVIDLASKLVRQESLSPNDAGCQEILGEALFQHKFDIVNYSRGQTTNSWASKEFDKNGPTLVFAGHTDVVPTGNLADWTVDDRSINPFALTEVDGYLHGRGVADMKGALASMVVATQEFLAESDPSSLKGKLGFIFTSDEEDDRTDGTQVVVEALKERGEGIDYAVVGEASSLENVGDRIYVARRGSFHLKEMIIRGLVGHVAKDNGIDATEIAVRLQNEAYETVWDDQPDPRFPETSFKTWLISGGFEAENMVSGLTVLRANWRNNPASTGDTIRTRFEDMAERIYDQIAVVRKPNGGRFEYKWALSGEPYATPEDAKIVSFVKNAVQKTAGYTPELSGGGGTSDGGVISSTGADVVELGLQGQTIHEANERVPLGALEKLKDVYKQLMRDILLDD